MITYQLRDLMVAIRHDPKMVEGWLHDQRQIDQLLTYERKERQLPVKPQPKPKKVDAFGLYLRKFEAKHERIVS
jgi:hypothetical protein